MGKENGEKPCLTNFGGLNHHIYLMSKKQTNQHIYSLFKFEHYEKDSLQHNDWLDARLRARHLLDWCHGPRPSPSIKFQRGSSRQPQCCHCLSKE
jgi:hypothetical protein